MAKKKKKIEIPPPAPLDLDSILNEKRPRNKIAAIGVELEGGWEKAPDGYRVVRDGSVFKDMGDENHDTSRLKLPGLLVGEVQFGPVQPAALAALIKKCYPQRLDPSCGLHVHMSFDSTLKYSLLTAAEYQATIIEYLMRFAKLNDVPKDNPIWERLEGKSIYCQHKHWPWKQITNARGKDFDQQRDGHRYTAIHYCWQRTNTIECRLLPMFSDTNLSIQAVKCILDVTNACLVKLSAGIKVRSGEKVYLPDGVIYEEHVEEIL